MIARIWRGWTAADLADEYAAHLREIAVPALEAMGGNLGVHVLRRRLADGVEFTSFSVWDSTEAMSGAAMPEDHRLLVGRETIPAQWEVVASTDVPPQARSGAGQAGASALGRLRRAYAATAP